MNKLTEQLFELLDGLNAAQLKLNQVIKILNAEENEDFLDKEIAKVEIMIVESLGGNEGHHKYLSSVDYFWNYREDELDREQLVDEIKVAIDNDIQGSNPIEITFG